MPAGGGRYGQHSPFHSPSSPPRDRGAVVSPELHVTWREKWVRGCECRTAPQAAGKPGNSRPSPAAPEGEEAAVPSARRGLKIAAGLCDALPAAGTTHGLAPAPAWLVRITWQRRPSELARGTGWAPPALAAPPVLPPPGLAGAGFTKETEEPAPPLPQQEAGFGHRKRPNWEQVGRGAPAGSQPRDPRLRASPRIPACEVDINQPSACRTNYPLLPGPRRGRGRRARSSVRGGEGERGWGAPVTPHPCPAPHTNPRLVYLSSREGPACRGVPR